VSKYSPRSLRALVMIAFSESSSREFLMSGGVLMLEAVGVVADNDEGGNYNGKERRVVVVGEEEL